MLIKNKLFQALADVDFSMAKKYSASFRAAFKGLLHFYILEFNSRVHILFALAACVLGYLQNLSSLEWLFLLLAICMVFVSELFNTALEKLCDLYSTELNPKIAVIKDISAAAVLLCSMFAVIVGLILFIPKWI